MAYKEFDPRGAATSQQIQKRPCHQYGDKSPRAVARYHSSTCYQRAATGRQDSYQLRWCCATSIKRLRSDSCIIRRGMVNNSNFFCLQFLFDNRTPKWQAPVCLQSTLLLCARWRQITIRVPLSNLRDKKTFSLTLGTFWQRLLVCYNLRRARCRANAPHFIAYLSLKKSHST